MRRLKHIIFTVLILALIGYIAWEAYPVLEGWLMVSKKDSKNPAGTSVQLTYQLSQDKWTVFPLDAGTKFLKLISNAEYFKTYENTVKYAIAVEILNSSGKVLMEQTFNFKNDARVYMRKHSSRVLSNPFLVKGMCYITPNLTFLLPISDFKKPAFLRLKWNPKQTEKNVKNVLVRVSAQSAFSSVKRNVLWYRLSPDTRKSLASGNFYPDYLLTDSEKQNILSHLWSPIGPQGNKGVDYFVRRVGRMPADELKNIHLLDGDGEEPKKEEKADIKTEMYKLYLGSGIGGMFKPQTSKEINAAKQLFIKLFNGSTASELKNDWKKLGMNVVEFKRGKRTFTLVYEEKEKLFGRGFYIFCKSGIARNIALEMPHRFWDTHTGIIGYRLMLTGYFTAAAWNTVQRYQTPNDLSSSSDMAHADNSFFYSFSKAFAESMPKKSMLIQPHGFSNQKQHAYYTKKAAVVLSNSTHNPSKQFLFYAELLKKVMPQPTYIYPLTNVIWLASLDNVSAKVLRNEKKNQVFIHMEMNDKTRKDMMNESSLRKKFTNSIIEETTKHYPAAGK